MVLVNPIFPSIKESEDKSSPFKNRLRKNARHLSKWAKRTSTDCFRLYDRDIKAYPVAIDYYAGRFLVHYYFHEDGKLPAALVESCQEALQTLFEVPVEHQFQRIHRRHGRGEQYEKIDSHQQFFTVHEYGAKFLVNLSDYQDSGLFLDHRESRKTLAALAKGKSLLNLFAYTAAFSVQAAFHGALFTKSVDLSNSYTEWAKKNFLLNGLSLEQNAVVRADCLRFLDSEIASKSRYDLIVCDPPTLSRSKKMEGLFDIQKDHPELIVKALKLLKPGGKLFFSTNCRSFSLEQAPGLFQAEEMTEKTLPDDFRDRKAHRSWFILPRAASL